MSLYTLGALGSLPILFALILLAVFHRSAKFSMGIGWIVATLLGLFFWNMNPGWWFSVAIYGALQATEIVAIIFGAVLLMNYLERSGAISTIRWHFSKIQGDRRVQLVLIGFGFVVLIEGVAGFGTPAVLAAPLLIGLGFPPLAAAVFGLFFNAPNPPFGVAGIPTVHGIGSVIGPELPSSVTTAEFLSSVTRWTGVLNGLTYSFWGILAIFLMIFWFGRKEERSVKGAFRATLPSVPFAVVLGLVTGFSNWLVSWFMGPELPDIIAGFTALGIGFTMARYDIMMPGQNWHFPGREEWPQLWTGGLPDSEMEAPVPSREMSVLRSWLPYVLVAAFLVVTRMPGTGMLEWLNGFKLKLLLQNTPELSFVSKPLSLPGVLPFLPIAVLTGFFHRLSFSQTISAWRESTTRIIEPALTLIVAVSMAQIMIQSSTNSIGRTGMMDALSRMLAGAAGKSLPFASPWIGALGGFVTGSNTSSNILFSALQYGAANDLGVQTSVIVALQNIGGGIGNLVSVLNITAVGGVIGIIGYEGYILRKTIVPTVIYGIIVGLFGLFAVYFIF